MNEIQAIQNKIYEIRGQRVMLDFDLAAMYGVETRRLNEQVKRNIERFPEDFMFQLTKGELEILKSQIVTSNVVDNQDDSNWTSQIATSNFVRMGLRKPPYTFTEAAKDVPCHPRFFLLDNMPQGTGICLIFIDFFCLWACI